jgi:hypothetical protein
MTRKPRKVAAQPQPTKAKFVEYAREKGFDVKLAADQWEAWDAGEWCDGDGTPILRWKLKLVTFAKAGYGVFGQRPDRRKKVSQEGDERTQKNKAARESEALNRMYEQRQKRRD